MFRPALFMFEAWFLLAALLFPIGAGANPQDPCTRVARALEYAQKIRGLSLDRPLQCIALDKQQFIAKDLAYLHKIISQRDLEHLGRIYRGIGLIPETYDFARCYLSESSQYASAFYDIFTKEIVLPRWEPVPMNVLVHEVVHALQDRAFDLKGPTLTAAKTTDASNAFSALIEGDARVTQELFLKLYPGAEDTPVVHPAGEHGDSHPCAFPFALDSFAYFPYLFGKLFVDRLLSDGSFAEVNLAYSKAPFSTTEILHRDAYGSRTPEHVPFDPAEVRSAFKVKQIKALHSDTIGQYGIRVLLHGSAGDRAAILGAKGWRADRAELFETEQGNLLIWKSVWASESEAAEVYPLLVAHAEAVLGISLQSNSVRIRANTSQGGTVLLTRSGASITFARLFNDKVARR